MTDYEKYKEYYRSYYLNMKIQALETIQILTQCTRCGCDDVRLLEINHKNGGGYVEQKTKIPHGAPFYSKLIRGKRKTDDLELLCRPCNAIHYLEMKYNEKFPLNVVWGENFVDFCKTHTPF